MLNPMLNIKDRVIPITPTKPSIDWSHVAPKWKYLATDSDGKTHLFEVQPQPGVRYWSAVDWGVHSILSASAFASFTPGTCYWRESLVDRASLATWTAPHGTPRHTRPAGDASGRERPEGI